SSSSHELAHPFDEHEGGVPFVRVPGGRVVSQRPERPHAADAQNPLLPQSQVGPTGVQPMTQPTVRWVILLEVRVEQKNRHAAHHDPPRTDAHVAPREAHRGEAGVALRPAHRLERRRVHVEALLRVLLPSVEPQSLVRVSLDIEQADADQWEAQVRRRLALVPGEHADASGIDGNLGEPSDPLGEGGEGGEGGTAVLGLSHPACKLKRGGWAWEALCMDEDAFASFSQRFIRRNAEPLCNAMWSVLSLLISYCGSASLAWCVYPL